MAHRSNLAHCLFLCNWWVNGFYILKWLEKFSNDNILWLNGKFKFVFINNVLLEHSHARSFILLSMSASWFIFFISHWRNICLTCLRTWVEFSSMLSSRSFIVLVIIFIPVTYWLQFCSILSNCIRCEVWVEVISNYFFYTWISHCLKDYFSPWSYLRNFKKKINDHLNIGLFLDSICFSWYMCFSFANTIST